MSEVKFGVSVSEYYDLKEAIHTAKGIEELGFDSLWMTENVRSEAASLEPLIALGIIASHTTRIAFGPAVVLLPLRNPVGLAHAAVTLDRLSGGRFLLGIGAGGDAPDGFNAYGVPMSERGRRCDEALEVMKRLWTETTTTFNGKYFSFTDYGLGARPVQKPHPPIWLGGARSEAVLRRVARYADAFYPTRLTPPELARQYNRIEGYAREYGRDMTSFVKSVYLRFSVGSTVEEARERACRALMQRYRIQADHPLITVLKPRENCIVGTSKDCIETLEKYIEVGATHIVLDPACAGEEILPQFETFAREIMPRFR